MSSITTTQITPELYTCTGFDLVNVYLFPKKKLVIDTGNPVDKAALKKAIAEIIPCSDIKHLVLTHLHYDHAGNVDIFPKARMYAHEKEIKALHDFAEDLTFNAELFEKLTAQQIFPIEAYCDIDFLYFFTPGHTPGGLSILYTDPKTRKRYLFSGDVLFRNGVGRTDFPSSLPEKMQSSLSLLEALEYDELLPGHDY